MSDLHGWLSGLNPVLQFAALVPFFAAFWLLSRPLSAALIRLVPASRATGLLPTPGICWALRSAGSSTGSSTRGRTTF
jgi:hypothetical protein